MILSENLLDLRERNGWSQEELAEKLNVSRQAVSKWEVGAAIPDLDRIMQLSDIFGVTTDYLLKDSIEEVTYSDGTTDSKENGVRMVSMEEADAFMKVTANVAGKIAAGVGLCILSPICLIQLGGLVGDEQRVVGRYGRRDRNVNSFGPGRYRGCPACHQWNETVSV